MLRLYITVVMLGKERSQTLAGGSVIDVQVHVLLGTVQHLYVDAVICRPPCYVGQITFIIKISDIHPNGGVFCCIIDSQCYDLRLHAVHGVPDLLESTGAGCDVQQRELRDAALILLVERNTAAVR